MAEFDPTPPPLDLPAAPAVLSPTIPLNPPMVGTASPFIHVDGQNRDLILESIRTWVRTALLPWTEAWQTQLTAWETDAATQLDAWMVLADDYITAHALSGYSFRTTATDIAGGGATNVVLTDVDEDFRPVIVGDLVLDSSADGYYGIVTVVIDPTHATVAFVGSLRGPQGIQGIQGIQGVPGVVQGLVAGTHITIDNTDPAHPIITATSGGSGTVETVVAGTNIDVDDTDPANPIVSAVLPIRPDLSKALVVGTSISAGTDTGGVSWVNDFPAAYALRNPTAPAITMTNQAVSGAQSIDELATLIAHIADDNYGYVFIEVSVNDYKTGAVDGVPIGLDTDGTIKYITQMLAIVKAHGAIPILVGSALWNDPPFGLSAMAQTLAQTELVRITAAQGITFANLLGRLSTTAIDLVDGLHPTLTGHLNWAACIAAAMGNMTGDSMLDGFLRVSDTTLNPSYCGMPWNPVGDSVWGTNSHFAYSVTNVEADTVLARMRSWDMQITGFICENQGDVMVRASDDGQNGYIVDFATGHVYTYIAGVAVSIHTFTPPDIGTRYLVSVEDQILSGALWAAVTVQIDDTVLFSGADNTVPQDGQNAGFFNHVSEPAQAWSGVVIQNLNWDDSEGAPIQLDQPPYFT